MKVIGALGGEDAGVENCFIRFARRVNRHTKRATAATTANMIPRMATALSGEGSVVGGFEEAGKAVAVWVGRGGTRVGRIEEGS